MNEDTFTDTAEIADEIPAVATGKIRRLERIELLRDALLPKAMKGDVKSVATIIMCDDLEDKILDDLENNREQDSILKMFGNKPVTKPAINIYYTPGECAAILGVTPNTIRKTIMRGELAASLTPGGHYRILMKELGRYRASKTQKMAEKSNESNATPQNNPAA